MYTKMVLLIMANSSPDKCMSGSFGLKSNDKTTERQELVTIEH